MKKLLLKFQGRIDIYPPYQAVAIDVDFYRLIRQKVETFFDDQVLGIAQDRFGVTIFQPVLNKKGNGSPSESMNESMAFYFGNFVSVNFGQEPFANNGVIVEGVIGIGLLNNWLPCRTE